jgi:hypothetical protein
VHLKSVLIRDVAFDRKGLIIGGLLYFTICGKIMWRGLSQLATTQKKP